MYVYVTFVGTPSQIRGGSGRFTVLSIAIIGSIRFRDAAAGVSCEKAGSGQSGAPELHSSNHRKIVCFSSGDGSPARRVASAVSMAARRAGR